MWESPIYKFKTDINGKKCEILVDVTGSAPNFTAPGKQLEGAFDVLLKGLVPSKTKILDFGGAKLRNTLHLLKKGYTVYCCEFEDLFKRSKQANEFLEKCRKYPNFKKLVFPRDFIAFDDTFDVVLLINVLNIMPVPIERHYVLALCREKMKESGRLLWYTQHGTYDESTSVARLYDGLVTGKGRAYHMFYRDFTRSEIHEMMNANGFTYDSMMKFPSAGANQAYAFTANGVVLVDRSLGLTEQLRVNAKRELKVVKRKTWKTSEEEEDPSKRMYETGIPRRLTKVDEVSVLQGYLDELPHVPAGKTGASKYHHLIFNILKSVFEDRLRKPRFEEFLAEDTQRADITFQNERVYGFFKQLAEGYNIVCPNIFIECKNYRGDIGNPEFAQIHNRLNKIRGQFGIIVCRTIKDARKARDRQNNLKNDQKYVIVATDADVRRLVKLRIDGKEDGIDDLLEDKFKRLT